MEHVISYFSESASEREMGISVIYFNIFQYNKAVEQRRIDPVVRTGPKSVLTLSRMAAGKASRVVWVFIGSYTIHPDRHYLAPLLALVFFVGFYCF